MKSVRPILVCPECDHMVEKECEECEKCGCREMRPALLFDPEELIAVVEALVK